MNTDKIYAEAIANEYSVKTDSKVVALRKLDGKVKNPPTVLAFTLGVVSTLVFGTGMCLTMGTLGGGTTAFVFGLILGVVGMAGAGLNYPIYKRFLASRKGQYARDIIALANQIACSEE